MTYFFILGNNPNLSIAEIASKIEKGEIKLILPNILIVEAKKTININLLQNQLGGTIKIGQIITVLDINELKKAEQLLIAQMLSLFPSRVSKVFFGFSIYGHKNIVLNLKHVALALKKKLKKKWVSSRWVVSKQKALSSVIVVKNKLLTQGAEFIFFNHDDHIWFGKTITCQKFEKYSFYDYARPYRAIEKGMIPPKLAQIMINLSKTNTARILLDPFCGSGTILQQALLMGYTKVWGSDTDSKAVNNSKKNLQWLIEKSNIKNKKSKLQIKIQKCNAQSLDKKMSPQSIDAIITEPYLGPLRFKISDVRFQIAELSRLYIMVFQSFKKVLKIDGKIIIIFPVFNIRNKLHFLPILDTLKENGWKIQIPFPAYLLKSQIIKVTDRNSVIYSRPDQKVLREILIFKYAHWD